MFLFLATIIPLFTDLKSAGCGIYIKRRQGSFLLSLRAFVDDLVVLATSPEQLQVAVNIVATWAKRIRMNINIGTNKSAVMAWGPGKIPASPAIRLNSQNLLMVVHYKYVGVWISNRGGWTRHVLHMREKCLNKTHEIVAWCKAHGATVDVAASLWDMCVKHSAELTTDGASAPRWLLQLSGL